MLFVRVIRCNTSILRKTLCTDHSKWNSILDDPKVRSPFDNPRRTIASPLPLQNKSTKPLVFATTSDATAKEDLKHSDLKLESLKESSGNGSHVTEPLETSSPTNISSSNLRSAGFFSRLGEKLGLRVDENLTELEQKAQRTTRATKLGCFFVFGGILVGFACFCIKNGKKKRDVTGEVIADEYMGMWLAPLYRVTDALYFWKKYITEPCREKLLPEPLKSPYYQPKYTIVIEMKNILVNPEWTYKTGHRFKKRPALEYFLDTVGYPQFELVIYTSESSMTAPAIVESLDPKHRIVHRLYRECNKFVDGHYVKDLSRLNRDLSKVIYIDFDPNSFKLNPDNVLRVQKWEGDMNDTALIDLAELLKLIYVSDVDDVRPILQYYSQFENPAAEFRRRASMLVEQDKELEKNKNEPSNHLKRFSSNRFFGRYQSV